MRVRFDIIARETRCFRLYDNVFNKLELKMSNNDKLLTFNAGSVQFGVVENVVTKMHDQFSFFDLDFLDLE